VRGTGVGKSSSGAVGVSVGVAPDRGETVAARANRIAASNDANTRTATTTLPLATRTASG
jgi:hypothetical protein